MGPIERIASDMFAEWFADEPVMATAAGAPGYDDQLGDFSAEAFERRERWTRRWLDVFGAVPDDDLAPDDRIDRDVVRSHLRGQVVLAELPDWRRDPHRYLDHTLFGVALLFQNRLRPEPETVDAACARLRQVPGVFAEARRNLDPDLASALLVRRAAAAASGGQAYVRALPGLVDPALRPRLVEAGGPAARAFDEFGAWLGEFADRARGDWRLGERRYTALLRDRELLDLDATGLHERGLTACTELVDQLQEVAARVPGGGTDWRAALDAVDDDHPPTPEAMLDGYAAATRRSRDFVARHDLVSFADGERCQVEPAPHFARPIYAVALYAPTPSLAPSRTGHFYVPYPPDGAAPDLVRQRLRGNSRPAMATIAAHETYPGHHWQLSWSAGNPRMVRRLLATPYFTEGWALYAEALMREHGFFTDPREELAHLKFRLFRAARMALDPALHAGGVGVDEAVEFLVDRVAIQPDTARSEVEEYCAEPTRAPAYLTGALTIERIRRRWRARNPGSPLREFHDLVAGSAGLPLGLAEQVALR